MTLGHVKACHQPHNERCPHNADVTRNCKCKRPSKPPLPYHETRITLRPEFIEHRMGNKLVVQLHSDGLLRLRELGRRRVYETNVGKVYRGCVWREAMLAAQAHKAERKSKKSRRVKRRRR